MLHVGLTGGIATGKSTVAKMLQRKGAYLIDFDLLTRQAYEPGQPAWLKIIDYFGTGILNSDETINRKKLGDIVFREKDKLAKLNELVHPLLFEKRDLLMETLETNQPDAIVISDIPLLIEKNLQKDFDVVVLVYSSPQQQMQRLTGRNGCTAEEALERISSQMPIKEKVPHADIVIDNSASLEKTQQQVDDLWKQLVTGSFKKK